MRRRLARALGALAALALGLPAGAQAAPLLTVGVDVTSASATQATYDLYVANRGTDPAHDVRLSNVVPSNLTYQSSDRVPLPPEGGGNACATGLASGGTCRWAIGELLPGGSATMSVTYSLNQTGGYTVANAASAQKDGSAPAAGDATDSDSTLVRRVDVITDTHVSRAAPGKNFGLCPHVDVQRDGDLAAFFLDETVAGGTGPVTRADRVWSARLTAKVASITPGGTRTLALHRLTSRSGVEGGGPCEGADDMPLIDGDDNDIRDSHRPEAAAAPAATATVTGPGEVGWDAAGELDTRDEAFSFHGFELRLGGAGANGDQVSLHSSEAAAADRPTLVTVRTDREFGRCVDSDPETQSAPSDAARRFDAYVTEGSSGIERSDQGGLDACPGFPIAGWEVGWELDDDTPDSYISSVAGAPTTRTVGGAGDAGPNDNSSLTGADGQTYVEVRRGDPWAPLGSDAEIKLAAIAIMPPDGSIDPNAGPDQGVPEPGAHQCGSGGAEACGGTGESVVEDDARHTWTAPLSTKPATTGSDGGGGAGAPGGGDQPRTALRSIALTSSTLRGTVGREMTLHGRLYSSDPACIGPREYVQILRRRAGTTQFTDFLSVSTEADGGFDLPVLLDASSDYLAQVPERTGCAAASSAAIGVSSAGRVLARVVRGRGTRRMVRGSVLPAVASRVVLERRAGRRWVTQARGTVSRRGAFAIPLRVTWRGKRSFRVRWIPPSAMFRGATSRALSVAGR